VPTGTVDLLATTVNFVHAATGLDVMMAVGRGGIFKDKPDAAEKTLPGQSVKLRQQVL
jgi:hypothetical protein